MKNAYEVRGDVTAIFVRWNGNLIETLIDTCDLSKADSFPGNWYATKTKQGNALYVRGDIGGRGKRIRLMFHRFITNADPDKVVDHINNDGLDNRRSCNLRVVTHSQNMQNRRGATIKSKSGIRNVSWNKKLRKWLVCYQLNKKSVTVGFFDSLEAAERVAKKIRAENMYFSKEATERRLLHGR